MSKWNGRMATDIRDAEPDWAPYVQPKAPEGAPNVLVICWDDVGHGAMDVHGGPIDMPNMRRIADMGISYGNFDLSGEPFIDHEAEVAAYLSRD